MRRAILLRILFVLASSAVPIWGQTSNCHNHGTVLYCDGPDGRESPVSTIAPSATSAADAPASTTAAGATGTTSSASETGKNCHFDNGVEHCEDHAEASPTAASNAASGTNCHFHAGVEHCESHEESTSAAACSRIDRDYNIPFRVGALFVILTTSSIASFGPMLAKRLMGLTFDGYVFTFLKQFGTGVIIATAYVHLLTHAALLFANECVGKLAYEATPTAISMAGIFLTFVIEYFSHRLVDRRKPPARVSPASSPVVASEASAKPEAAEEGSASVSAGRQEIAGPDDPWSVTVMEAGIIFHSILIGIVLVVTGDSFFSTLFVVIIFHQMFEGFALGTRIAALPSSVGRLTKLLMASAFAIITPLGMAIGLGVLERFNGNDRSTIIALATLDSLSAGILVWVGLVDMMARDWMFGYLKHAKPVKVAVGMIGLIMGFVLMGVLARWA